MRFPVLSAMVALIWSALTCCETIGKASEPAPPHVVSNWHFDADDASRLVPHGGVHRDQAGPRPPHFPNFGPNNTAVLFDGDGAYYSIDDPGDDSDFDFDLGDRLTIDAWVDLHSIGSGENVYVIGKGRTGNKRFARDNQNWALRLRQIDGSARLSFLFATKNADSGKSTWHRWTSNQGIQALSGWHRIAISYRFGTPASIEGWIDDQAQTGSWDMGGETSEAPVVDNDSVWIGSSMGGSRASSFRGLIDEVTIIRGELPSDFFSKRFERLGTAPSSQLPKPELPTHSIEPQSFSLTIREKIPSHSRWPYPKELGEPVSVTSGGQEWSSPYLFLPRMPRRFDTWGVRDSWKPPVLVHLAGEVEFPAATISILVRNRGLGRLWIDDQVVLETPPHQGSTDGHNDVDPLALPPLPGHRVVAYGDTETIAKVTFDSPGTHRVVLETIVGGDKFRVESGETLVAFWTEGSDSIELLRAAGSSSPRRWLTDRDIDVVTRDSEALLEAFDDRVRRHASQTHRDYWTDRHEYAREVVAMSQRAAHEFDSIDGFLDDRIETASAMLSQATSPQFEAFHTEVLPILREHCFRCHNESAEGGLALTSRESALAGGDSGDAAIVPNHPESSLLVDRIFATDEDERMPPSGKLTGEQAKRLVDWIKSGAVWTEKIDSANLEISSIIDDSQFLRRASLDTVGVPPSEAELRKFLDSPDADKRAKAIDRLLADEGYADHWVSFWQDLLAENPNVLKPSLNNTGPFRWFLHDSLRDDWPIDRMVTELLMFRGSEREGGSAGFAMAADNDAPLASRAHVAAASLLGINLQCARCHDSPYHSTTQQDLFSLAAMLSRGELTVPPTSTVAPGFFENKGGRESLIRVTLKPGVPVKPEWRFAELLGVTDDDNVDRWLRDPEDTRERLAALVTSPHNRRFAEVMVNHYWKRLVGAGFVEPANDWEGASPSHPQLLGWLADEFIASGYDAKHLMRLVMNSNVYQREAIGHNQDAAPADRFFAAPDRRRMSAEQVVDSLYFATGREMDVEQLTFDPESRRPATTMVSLGYPKRAWEFSTLSNERDRPSLALPRAQAVTDVLEAFGWTGSRQNAIVDREQSPNVLQSGMLGNGVMSSWLTRASIDSELAISAINAASPESLVESLYLRLLSRYPTPTERTKFVDLLRVGFDDRLLPSEEIVMPKPPAPLGHVSWSNHLKPEANRIQVEMQSRARIGDPADPRLRDQWREAYEDVVWSIVNSPEFVFVP